MATLISNIFNIMDYADPRMKKFPFMNSPHPVLWILFLYILAVVYGPKYMEDKQPFNLKTVLLIYNPVMCIYNFLIVYFTISKYMTRTSGSFSCLEVGKGESQDEIEILYIGWAICILKFIELADTAFFILRKKNSQITVLHVYHHASVVVSFWLSALLVPGGQVWFVISLNSCVHVAMYGYYTLAAIGPHMQKYLWWKRYLTILQLIQFILLMFHSILNHYTDCKFPKLYNKLLIPFLISHFLLFTHFYYKTYKAKKTAKKE